MARPCAHCGFILATTNARAIYCGNRCKLAAFRARNPPTEEQRRAEVRRVADWRRENPDKLKSLRAQELDRAKSRRAASGPISSEAAKERCRNHYRANPEIYKERSHDRKRRLRVGGGLSRGITSFLMTAQGNACAACRTDLRVSGFHRDHIVPLAAGGLHVDGNIQLLCPPCNRSKGAMPNDEWMASRGFTAGA